MFSQGSTSTNPSLRRAPPIHSDSCPCQRLPGCRNGGPAPPPPSRQIKVWSAALCQRHPRSNHHDLLDWCFVNPPKLNTIEFIPASNFVVPKENILKYSKNLYNKLKKILNYKPALQYDPTCAEAHIVERMFYLIWNENLIERNYMHDYK